MKKIFLSLVPFFLFLSFYFTLIYFYRAEKIVIPNVVGKNILDLINIDNIFSWRIYRVSYNNNLPHGYIQWQYPKGNVLFKSSRSILLEINYNKVEPQNIKNTILDKCLENFRDKGINYKLIPVFLPGIKNNTIMGGMRSDKDDLFYIYYVETHSDLDTTYLLNCVGMKCSEIKSRRLDRLQQITCKNSDNKNSFTCLGEVVINQFPECGILFNNNKKIYFWHENITCNKI